MTDASTDYYAILGVDKSASGDDIRRAYKKMALQCHPDKNKDCEDAEQRFQSMCRAYECLIDPERRADYDARHAPATPPLRHPPSFTRSFFRLHLAPDTLTVSVSPREIYDASTKRVVFPAHDQCSACNGSGAHSPEDFVQCLSCMGSGRRMINPVMCMLCASCGGRGKAFNTHRRCAQCGGACVTSAKRVIAIDIAPCMCTEGFNCILPGKGSYDVRANAYKDLIIKFAKSEPFPAQIDVVTGNLTYVVELSIAEVMCGYSKEIDLFGVESIRIDAPGYSCPTKEVSIPGKGLSVGGSRGNVMVTFRVVWPDTDDASTSLVKYKEVLERIFARAGLH